MEFKSGELRQRFLTSGALFFVWYVHDYCQDNIQKYKPFMGTVLETSMSLYLSKILSSIFVLGTFEVVSRKCFSSSR